MHLDSGTMWREGVVPGKMLGSKPIRLRSGFPLSWGIGLYSGSKKARISCLVWACYLLLLVLLESRVYSFGTHSTRVNVHIRNVSGALDAFCWTNMTLLFKITATPQEQEAGWSFLEFVCKQCPWSVAGFGSIFIKASCIRCVLSCTMLKRVFLLIRLWVFCSLTCYGTFFFSVHCCTFRVSLYQTIIL